MAERLLENGEDGCGNAIVADTENEVHLSKQTSKRCSSPSPIAAPPQKSPRSDLPITQTSKAGKAHSETDEMQIENTEGPSVSPTARRKSWRRSAINRRSLPVLPNPNQALCLEICTSLPQEKRLEKLMEASMKLAVERTKHLFQSVPNASLESFQRQVESIQKQWGCLPKSIHSGPHCLSSRTASKPAAHRDMEKFQTAIKRLQAESESWEALLNKHRRKAEELERKVEQGQKTGISLDSTSVARSSQYLLIQNKPDYSVILCKQKPMLHTMAMIIDSQCKMAKELLSIKEITQLLVKKTSGHLAAEAGFQDLSSDLLRNLMAAPVSTTTS
ncbi:kinetochore-associated protein DSN1 homolog [Mugil cephalus]|uniref:kinetochore-associated protein DSN1 homolog n=1 Tax=Mugil cephalus TaxID=48193 RepID=UPI001FB62D96|nr:kinetochore-associated protein DSN1 homolog [Mugil cephalus]